MKVLIDIHEPKKYQTLFQNAGHEVEVNTLPIGDFIINNGRTTICYERKEISDAINSIRSGHLTKQLLQMDEAFGHSYLIIIGSVKDYLRFANRGWSVEHHLGALASILVRHKTKIVQVDNNTQAADFMLRVAEKTEDGKIVDVYQTSLLKSTLQTDDIYLKMICCIPGISIKKGMMLKGRFPSLRSLLDATKEQITELDGFGEKMAEKVKTYIK